MTLIPINSAASRVSEPPNCYVDFIDPVFRYRAPRIEHDLKRGYMFKIKGSKQPVPLSLVSAAGKAPEKLSAEGAVFEKLHRGGWAPEARMDDQRRDGIAAAIINSSVGMELCKIPDLDLKQAAMEA